MLSKFVDARAVKQEPRKDNKAIDSQIRKESNDKTKTEMQTGTTNWRTNWNTNLKTNTSARIWH